MHSVWSCLTHGLYSVCLEWASSVKDRGKHRNSSRVVYWGCFVFDQTTSEWMPWEFAPRLGSHSKSCFTFYMQQLRMSFSCSKALLCCFACSWPTCSSEPCLLCVTLYFSETSLCCFGSEPTKAVKTKITITTRTNSPAGLNHKHLFLLVL